MYPPSDYSSNSRPLFGRRRKGTIQWERITVLGLGALSIVLFTLILYQSNRISVLALETEQLNNDLTRVRRESAGLRAGLSKAEQEKEVVEVKLSEHVENLDLLENSLTRQKLMTENAESEGRKTRQSLLECERTSKKREEELESQLATVNQEKRDLSIRVDTEHSISIDWSKKVANERLAREECEQKLNLMETKFTAKPDDQPQAKNETAHEEETAKQMGRKAAGGATEGEKHEESAGTQ